MKLPEKDVKVFYKLHHLLLRYTNKKYNLVTIPENFFQISLEDLRDLRNKLYDNPQLIDEYVEKNPDMLPGNELKIIESWHDFVRGDFVVIKYLKKYAIFLELGDTPKAYGVLALLSPFEEILGTPPAMVKVVLLPFKGKIIYDGIFQPYSIIFGKNYRKRINQAYQGAKFNSGIIESLPFDGKTERKDDRERLKFYLKNEQNRIAYEEEIKTLIRKDPHLLPVFHQEMSKIHARRTGRILREIGVSQGWFALLEGVVIGSGLTKSDVNKTIDALVPPQKKDFVYFFKLK